MDTPELPRFASAAQAQQAADDSMATLTKRIESIRARQQEALRAKASATSRDGRVRVSVDPTGVLTELEFTRSAFTDTTPEKLARTVLATAQQAAADARASLSGAIEGIRDGEMSSARAGAARLLGELSAPEVPRTASDPSGRTDPWASETVALTQDPDAPFDEALAELGRTSGRAE